MPKLNPKTSTKTHCGYVAIIGRPNVGKSTLLNQLLGEKISITSRKPQTTRQQILGIKTKAKTQVIYVDTPGLHRGINKALNRLMNRTALRAIKDVDVVVFLVAGLIWSEEEEWILNQLKKINTPVIIAINKVDKIQPKERLLPYLEQASQRYSFAGIIPISALKATNVDQLETAISRLLPEQPFYFDKEQSTNQTEAFFCAEIIREQLVRQLGAELPYATLAVIEQFKQENNLLRIAAVIYVEKPGQKIIVIGKRGEQLKAIGTAARRELERIFRKKVFIQLWVKVKSHWTTDEKTLKQLGFNESK